MLADGWELYWSCLLACTYVVGFTEWVFQEIWEEASRLLFLCSLSLFFFYKDTDLCFKSSYDLVSDVSNITSVPVYWSSKSLRPT